MDFMEARVKAGKTVLEVSRILEVSPAAIYKWEKGETMPTTANITKLAKLYGCTVDKLLRKEEKENA